MKEAPISPYSQGSGGSAGFPEGVVGRGGHHHVSIPVAHSLASKKKKKRFVYFPALKSEPSIGVIHLSSCPGLGSKG